MRLRVALLAMAAAVAGGATPSAAAAAEWTSLAPATLARTEVAAARVGRHVYVMGGFERDTRATTAATERYDIVRNRWTRVADRVMVRVEDARAHCEHARANSALILMEPTDFEHGERHYEAEDLDVAVDGFTALPPERA